MDVRSVRKIDNIYYRLHFTKRFTFVCKKSNSFILISSINLITYYVSYHSAHGHCHGYCHGHGHSYDTRSLAEL